MGTNFCTKLDPEIIFLYGDLHIIWRNEKNLRAFDFLIIEQKYV